jgi:hypothetical protein
MGAPIEDWRYPGLVVQNEELLMVPAYKSQDTNTTSLGSHPDDTIIRTATTC